MKRALVALFITLAIAISGYGQEHSRTSPTPTPRPATTPDPEGWVTFNSEEGRFTVLVPDIPNDKTETVPSEQGPYTTHLFIVRGVKSVFLLGWVDYDPSFNFNPARELDLNRENFIKGVNATLVSNRTLTIDGYQSIEFTAETADTLFRSRVYMVGRRPYQLVVGTTKGQDDSYNVNRFFNSFKVRLR